MTDQDRIAQNRAETASLLGVRVEELEYIVDEFAPIGDREAQPPTTFDEDVSETDVAAAQSLALVVPNRISIGVVLKRAGWNGSEILWTWLGPDCSRAGSFSLWSSSINRFEQSGYCRRPQTDSYDTRWKIYWRA